MNSRPIPETTKRYLAAAHLAFVILTLFVTEVAGSDSVVLGASVGEALLSTGRIQLRVHTDPPGDANIVVGQQTRLLVEILTDTWFSQAPRYPELTIPGAITLQPEQMGTNFTEDINGTTFSGQRRGYVLFPQRSGALEIPSFEIRLGVSQDGKPSVPFTLSTQAISLEIRPRAGVDERDGLVTTPRLTVEDEWDRSLEELEPGNAIERTVRIEGEDILGMLLPELSFEAPAGIAVYSEPARIIDRTNRGRYRGERSQTITYVLTERGTFEIPSIEIQWWNPDDGELRTERLESRFFEVKAKDIGIPNGSALSDLLNNATASITAVGARAVRWIFAHRTGLMVLALIGAVLIGLAHAYGPRARRTMSDSLNRIRNSEPQAFRALDRSLRNGDARQIVEAYWHWRERLDAISTRRTDTASLFKTPPNENEDVPVRLSDFPHWRAFEAQRYSDRSRTPPAASTRQLHHEMRAMRAIYLAKIDADRCGPPRATGPTATRTPLRLNPNA